MIDHVPELDGRRTTQELGSRHVVILGPSEMLRTVGVSCWRWYVAHLTEGRYEGRVDQSSRLWYRVESTMVQSRVDQHTIVSSRPKKTPVQASVLQASVSNSRSCAAAAVYFRFRAPTPCLSTLSSHQQ